MENNYSVYQHVTPDGFFYFGQTNNIKRRWRNNGAEYKGTALQPYIKKFGWDNIQHIVLFRDQTKENALFIENFLIETAREDGVCINQRRSGLVSKEEGYKQQISKQYYEQNKQQICEKQQEYYEQNKQQIREKKQEYYEQNKQQIREKKQEYYEENKDKKKQYREQNKDKIREYYETNKDKIREYQREYREQNKDKIREYREQNKDKIREYHRQYYQRKKLEKQLKEVETPLF